VCARLTEARLQQQSIRGNVALSLIQQIILELRLFFPVGISEQSMSYSSMFKSLQIGLMGFLLCAATAWAGPASIQGIVKDAKGQPIKAADVRIESVDGKQLFKTVKTDARGRYVSQGLQLRVYRVTLLVNGVVKACITNIKTKQDQATELNLDLKRVAAVQATTVQKKGKNMVWMPTRTGTHLGGNWVEVDEYGKAASDSNIHTGTGDDLRRQQLTQQPGRLPGEGPTPFP
jgi:Carboxypeptidase regulatory-like domain